MGQLSAVVLLLAGLILQSGSAVAGQWVEHGIGTNTCGQYLAAAVGDEVGTTRRWVALDGIEFHDNAYSYAEWINGYLTALNLVQADASNQLTADTTAISVWIKNYCNQHPVDSVLEAAVALWRTKHSH